jgi:hypothetical protein
MDVEHFSAFGLVPADLYSFLTKADCCRGTSMNPRSINLSLCLIARLKPEALDAGSHGLNVSTASRAYLMATAIEGFQSELGGKIDVRALSGAQRYPLPSASEPIAKDREEHS